MKRLTLLVAVVALLAAACGSGDAGPGEFLAYDLATSGDVEYDIAFDMDMSVEIDGIDEMAGGVAMLATFVGSIAYDVEPGPEGGQVELTVSSDLVPIELEIEVPGEEPIVLDDPDEIAATGEFDPEEFAFDQTFVIDETGEIVDAAIDGVSVPLEALQGGFGGFGASADPSTFLGPVLPDEAVSIGDQWTTVRETPLGASGPSITIETVSRLDREETLDGRRVLVIVSRTTTSGVDVDSDTLADLVAEDPTISQEEKDAFGLIDMTMRLEGSEGTSTTWFDPASGLVVRQEGLAPTAITMTVSLFGETVDMAMKMDMDLTMKLAG